jgi:hypothetical protein
MTGIRRSQLPIASDLEITENIWLALNTELNITKRKQLTDILRLMFGGVKFGKFTIPSADVLTSNTIPYDFIAAPGTGKAIEMVSCLMGCETYGGVPYATNIEGQIITKTATLPQLKLVDGLGFNTQTLLKMIVPHVVVAADTQIIENLAVRFFTPTADPTAGTSDVVLYCSWNELTL